LPEPTIRATERSLSVIKLMAEEHRPLSIGEISRATALAPATVHRVLLTLMKDDWIEQNPRTSRYRLGFGLLGTAAVSLAFTPLVAKARQALLRVTALSRQYSWLGVLVGRRIAYLAEVEGRATKYDPFQAGVNQYAHATCGGKVLLAALPAGEIDRLYRDTSQLHRYTEKTITERSLLAAELEKVRNQGYALDEGQLRQHWNGVALPVRGLDGRVIAALITGGLDVPMADLEAMVPDLCFISQELTIDLARDE
jgi:DNA-binding IclR family transcriptional regulator